MAKASKPLTTDTLENFITGMGTVQDKSRFTRWAHTILDRAQAEAAYRNDWIARKAVDIPANDATRNWRTWQADNDDLTRIEDIEDTFRVKEKINNAMKRGRLYGGAGIVMGVDQGTAEDPLDISKVQKDQLKFLHVVSKHDLHVDQINRDPLSEFYGQPTYYQVQTTSGPSSGTKIHPSRVIRFLGNQMPDPIALAVGTEQGWGDSVLQIVKDAILTAGTVIQSSAGLLHDAQVDVIKIPNMTANFANAGYDARLTKRMAEAAMIKSQFGLLLMDKEEEWARITSNLTGLPDLVRIYLLIVSGAVDIPATRFLGQAPTGLSATGESDTRNYYDRVSSDQSNEVSPVIDPLDEVIVRSALGDMPDGIFYNWNSLWQMTDEQRADLAAKKATTFKTDVDTGLFPDVVMREARLNQLIEDNVYPGLDLIVQEAEAAGEFDEEAEEEATIGLPPPSQESLEEEIEAERIAKDKKPRKRGGLARKPKPRDILKGRFTAVKGAGKLPSQLRSFFGDAKPRSLYVRREVVNVNDITKWAKGVGFPTVQKDLHVTIMFNRIPVDWMKIGDDWVTHNADKDGNITIAPGGVRIVEQLGDATVLLFTSGDLSSRHSSIKYRIDNDWEYPDYQPHITLSWDVPADLLNLINAGKITPYRGKIVLGPEIIEEVDENWKESIVEDAKWSTKS